MACVQMYDDYSEHQPLYVIAHLYDYGEYQPFSFFRFLSFFRRRRRRLSRFRSFLRLLPGSSPRGRSRRRGRSL